MSKKFRLLLLSILITLMFVFKLQYIVPAIYLTIGIVIYLFFFCWAKIRNLDSTYIGWFHVLNSTEGFLYFIISGSVLWMLVLIPLYKEQREKRKILNERNKDRFTSWIEYIKDPMKLHRNWFNNFYQ